MTGRNGPRNAGAVVRRIKLGRALRELREAAGLSVEVAAPRLDWSASKLSRIENGQQGIDVHGVKSMLDLYEGSEQWDELIDLTRQTRQKGWWRAFGLDDQGYVPLEAEATSVHEVTSGYMPGLLQTADYARSVFLSSSEPRTPAEIERFVAVRMHRQTRLAAEEHGLSLTTIIGEAALHHVVGGAAVMARQLKHLATTAQLPTVVVQVIPFGEGAHPALAGGFSILRFADLGIADMAYVEHALGAVHVHRNDDVRRAKLRFEHLRSLALSPEESVLLIEKVAAQMR